MPAERISLVAWRGKDDREAMDLLALTIQIGLTMVGCIIFCFAVGYFLDKWLGTKGIFLTIFTLLGIVGGGVTVYRQIMSIENDPDDHGPGK
jgi:ATP synthase protein I